MANKQPNFLFIITDQQRADHVGCYGNNILKTPNIDSLAAKGIAFDKYYVASPTCMPNRASLATGRMPSATGVTTNGFPLPIDTVTLMDVLAAGGYRTALMGKSHLQYFTDRKVRPETFHEREGWSVVPAVKKNRIYEIKSPMILQPGPAALTDGLDKLAQIFDLYDHGKHNLAY